MNAGDALDPKVDFIAGTAAGVAAQLVGHPFDTVVVRLQTASHNHKVPPLSAMSTLHTIFCAEGVRGLYKGVTAPMLGVAAEGALLFGVYGSLLRWQGGEGTEKPTNWQVFWAGLGAGVAASVLAAPLDLIKIRQQSYHISSPPSTLRIFLSLARRPTHLFRGLPITALRDTSSGPYFLTYAYTLSLFSPSSWQAIPVASALAGVIASVITYPLDVIKTRVQSVSRGSDSAYATARTVFRHGWRNEGPGLFVRGLGPTIVAAVPVNVATFGVFEMAVKALQWEEEGKRQVETGGVAEFACEA